MNGKEEMLSDSRTQTQIPQCRSKVDLILQLNRVANNLLLITPSQIKDQDIYELEIFFNALYTQAHTEAWPVELQDTVLEALSRASELSDSAMHMAPNSSRKRDFFKTLKSFVPILKMLAVFLEE